MKTQFTVYRCSIVWKVVYSSCWKISHISSVYKNKGEKLKNPTIVSLLLVSYMSRILQKIVYKSLYEYCASHELLIRDNSGFKWNDSTFNQLLAITHKIYKSLVSGKDVCAIFLDVSKSFAKV